MISLLAAVLAVEAIDLEMTPQEKKKTGVYKLRDQEKAALQQWIENRYEKRQEPLAQNIEPTTKPSLSENFYNGRFLKLSDGTLWNVRPQDTAISQSWITPVEVIITQSQDSVYSYKITNTLTGSSVLAKKVSSLPTTKPGPATPNSNTK